MLIRILSLFYQNIKKNVSLLEDEYYYDDDPYDYDDMYDVYDFDNILIKLRTMPILMISTMTIMMISGTMRTRKITGKRIIDLQPEKKGRGTSPRPLIKQIVNYNDVS